jgi:predicted GNAT superfamily acetyltransferase
MTIEIRPILTHAEYRAVEQSQRDIWGLAEVEIVPDHLLLTVQKNGGLVLGAFDSENEQLVGFVFGFVGLTSDGELKHCSHMAGVAPTYQSQNVGYRLKLAQRERVLAQGIDLITWTFDPLESRNARLNFRKLGATCKTYLRDLYGVMRDALNVGLPSDRFQVDWHISSHHVADRLGGVMAAPSLTVLQAEGVPMLKGPAADRHPSAAVSTLTGERLLIQIPSSFQDTKSADMTLAREWRLHTRDLFEAAFNRGYVVTDLLFENRESFYLLEKDWTPQ